MRVVIMMGISGSGKTTWHKQHRPGGWVVSADQFFETDAGYKFDPAKLSAAHGDCLRRFLDRLIAKESPLVVVDNTNTTLAEIAPYAALAQAFGADLELVHLECSPQLGAERNRHGTPIAVCEQQQRRLFATLASLPPWWPCQSLSVRV